MSPSDSPYHHIHLRIAFRVSRAVPGCFFDAEEVRSVLEEGGTTGTFDGDRLILEEAREYRLPNVPERSPMDGLR